MSIRLIERHFVVLLIGSLFVLLAFFAKPTLGQDEVTPPFEEIDLSMWVKDHSIWGDTAFRNNQLFMRAKMVDDWFYVLIAPDDYTTAERNARVSLRNVRGERTKLGYGLVFHSQPTPLVQDYAFLIDSITRRYRIVRHVSGKERRVIKWTRTLAIKSGKSRNVLEVRDKGDSVDLYINRKFIRNLKTPYAAKNGQPGLYTDDTPIAFREFVISYQKIGKPKPKPLDLEIGTLAPNRRH